MDETLIINIQGCVQHQKKKKKKKNKGMVKVLQLNVRFILD